MHTNEILELLIYTSFIGYFISVQLKLSGKSAAATEFQQRMAERKKAGKFSLSTEDHRKLNWLGISAGVLLCARTAINALNR